MFEAYFDIKRKEPSTVEIEEKKKEFEAQTSPETPAATSDEPELV